MMSLEDTSGVTRLGLTVFEKHRVCARYVGHGSSHDLGHDGRTSCILVDGSLDQSLLAGGAAYQL